MNDTDLEVYSDYLAKLPEKTGVQKIKKGKTYIKFGTSIVDKGYDQLQFGCDLHDCANDVSKGGK